MVSVACLTIVVDVLSIETDRELRSITRACNRPPQRERAFVCENCGKTVRVQGSCVTRIAYACATCGRLVGLDNSNRLSVLHTGDVRMAVMVHG